MHLRNGRVGGAWYTLNPAVELTTETNVPSLLIT